MSRFNKETLLFLAVTVASIAFLTATIYRHFSLTEKFTQTKRELISLQRENLTLQSQITQKVSQLNLLTRKKTALYKALKRYPPFNSPELIGKRISHICVLDNLQIVSLRSFQTPKENYSLTTSVVLKGKEDNILKATSDILNSFPLLLKQISLFNDGKVTLQMEWKTPIISSKEISDEIN